MTDKQDDVQPVAPLNPSEIPGQDDPHVIPGEGLPGGAPKAAEPGVSGTRESVSPAPAPKPGGAPEYQGTPGVPVPGNDQPTDLPSDAPGHQGEID